MNLNEAALLSLYIAFEPLIFALLFPLSIRLSLILIIYIVHSL
jgi:hypothetical protein